MVKLITNMLLVIALIISFITIVPTVGYRNLSDIKDHAVITFEASGFQVNGYEGYQWDPFLGAHVWYIVKQPNSPILYHAFLCKWGTEYHIYELHSVTMPVSTE